MVGTTDEADEIRRRFVRAGAPAVSPQGNNTKGS